ncbi:hypothetical protein [Mammaliicoccus sciuri]|uniref:hypothetical protein n=1 Tax=Mammaliicoccus sciuri TaxID=1296 RepID=UPI0021CE1F6F|nr:hypothetical protein [Mammaliicoccus sciuri]UXU70126.1 hypothetical protein MUA36_05455 [Mammaliicoccus sciuri]
MKNFYVLENKETEIIKSTITERESDNLVYSYVEPLVYDLPNNKKIIVNELSEQWELIKQVGNHFVSELVSHDLTEIKNYI